MPGAPNPATDPALIGQQPVQVTPVPTPRVTATPRPVPNRPVRDTRFIYRINPREARAMKEGQQVQWRGNPVGVISNIHIADDANAYVSVRVDENRYMETRGILTEPELKEPSFLRVEGIALKNRIERNPYAAEREADVMEDRAEAMEERAEDLGPAAEARAERQEEIADDYEDATDLAATRQATREVADDVGDWTEETFNDAADWTAEAAEDTDEALAEFGDWAKVAGKDVKRYARAGWEETKEAYAGAVVGLSEQLVKLDAWAERKSEEADLEDRAEDLRADIEIMQQRLSTMGRQTAADVRKNAREMVMDARRISDRLIQYGEHDLAEDLDAAASELRVEIAREQDRRDRETARQLPENEDRPQDAMQ
jgi:hypothetical protein